MEFRDLKYFKKLVETKNYNETAQYFGVTQPAISSMVKRLEKEIGTKLLFQNSNRGKIIVSPAGKVVYTNAKNLITKENSIIIETYIFDFNSNIYGEDVLVTFEKYIRDEHKYSSLDDLCEELKSNEKLIRNYFCIIY